MSFTSASTLMRVLIADDSAFMRRALTQMLSEAAGIEVVGAARNGREAVEMAEKLKPDVITLDIEMPEMDGLTALSRIMRQCPTQVLMLSSLTTEGSHAALRALHLGAADVLAKDASQVTLSIENLREELITRVRLLGATRLRRLHKQTAHAAEHRAAGLPVFQPNQFELVCIGSSTGGPPILEAILKPLPATMRTPIVIAQHMPAMFTRAMAERLDASCALRVIHGQDGMPLERGKVYIAPGGRQTRIRRIGVARWALSIGDEPADALYRPSVDVLFESAAATTGPRTLGIVLTGMGQDGLIGGRRLHALGATLLAQNAESCVVYGMPKAVTEQALIAASLTPEQIAQAMLPLGRPVLPLGLAASHPFGDQPTG